LAPAELMLAWRNISRNHYSSRTASRIHLASRDRLGDPASGRPRAARSTIARCSLLASYLSVNEHRDAAADTVACAPRCGGRCPASTAGEQGAPVDPAVAGLARVGGGDRDRRWH